MRATQRVLPVAVVTAALALAGCGTSEHDQVKQKVQQFVHAVKGKDYSTLCKQVLSPSLLGHLSLYGIPCERAMSIGFGKLQDPQLAIGGITVKGKSASVTVITTATGQNAALTAVELVDTANGWRVDNLGTPVLPKKS